MRATVNLISAWTIHNSIPFLMFHFKTCLKGIFHRKKLEIHHVCSKFTLISIGIQCYGFVIDSCHFKFSYNSRITSSLSKLLSISSRNDSDECKLISNVKQKRMQKIYKIRWSCSSFWCERCPRFQQFISISMDTQSI